MRLIPRDTKFFDLFAELSGNLTEGAKLLRTILSDPRDLAMRVSQVQAIEHKGDKATHAIITKLNQSFITPFDREDIHRLASSLDDVLDFVNSAAVRLVMYKIVAPPPVSTELAGLIVLQCEELAKGVSLLDHDGTASQGAPRGIEAGSGCGNRGRRSIVSGADCLGPAATGAADGIDA